MKKIKVDIIPSEIISALNINPIWAFWQHKKTEGGGDGEMPPPPPYNLAISSQMTMKVCKDILWIKIFINWEEF